MKIRIIALLGALLCGNAAMACEFPEAPRAMPDGRTAGRDIMLAKMREMDKYRREVEAFISCEGNSQRTRNVQAQAERLASRFNAEVRAYKAANQD